MKTALLKSLLAIFTLVASRTVNAQTYDVYIANRALTASNQMEFDVYIVNNGSSADWALRSYQCGYKFATAFVNGGTLSGAFVSGSSDFPSSLGKSFGFSWNASANVLNQSANTGSSCPGGLVTSTARKIGRFRVTNTVNFGCADDGISMMRSGSGHLLFAVTRYNSALCNDNSDKSNTTITSGATTYVSGTGSVLTASAAAPATLNCGNNVDVTVSATGGFAATAYNGAGTFSRGEGTWNFTVSDDRGCQASSSVSIATGGLPSSSLTTVSACDSFNWNGTMYYASGSYPAQFTNASGCDSVATVDLTIVPSKTVSSASACNSYNWQGNTYTQSGNYTTSGFTSNGCALTSILQLTINKPASSLTNTTLCNTSSYVWNGNTYSTSGFYTYTTNNAIGCDSTAVLRLAFSTVGVAATATATMTQTLVSNNCGNRIYRFSAGAVTNANSFEWSLPASFQGGAVTVDSGFADFSQVILVRFSSNAAAGTTDSIAVRPYNGCSSGARKAYKLTNTALAVPAAPTITATVVTANTCGARVVRYTGSAPKLATASTAPSTGYAWVMPAGRLGATAVLDSGTLSGQIIRIRYTDNSSALGDTVRLSYTSDCGNSAQVKSAVTLAALNPPAAPTITATIVAGNVCGARVVRYTGAALKLATTSTGAATGYAWVLPVGRLGSSCVLDSGSLSGQIIKIRYTSNLAALGDTVRVAYTSDCGPSAQARSAVTLAALNPPAAPTITALVVVGNVCGARVVRYTGAALKLATTSTGAATGYEWVLPVGRLGSSCVLDSGTLSGQIIKVRYTSNLSALGDTVKLSYTSDCGPSAQARSAVTLAALNPPAAPTVTATVVISNVCGGRVVRYTASAPKLATTSTGASTGYAWVFPTGRLGADAVLDSGSLSGQVIRIKYTSNLSALGDTVRVAYTSDCGNSAQAKSAVTLAALNPPAAPASITQTLVSDVCYARQYRFAAPTLPAATTTAGAATGYDWIFVGALPGAGYRVDSGSISERVLLVTFFSNAAGGTGDSAKVRYTSGCGFSPWKAQKLSNMAKTGCPPPPTTQPITKVDINQQQPASVETLEASLYPNPTSHFFKLSVKSTVKNSQVMVRILDMQGREHKRQTMMPGEVISLGSELESGTYFIEVLQGRKNKVLKLIKL